MENLTRQSIFDLALVYGFAFGAFLLVSSFLSIRDNPGDPAIGLMRLLGGLILIVSLLVLHSSESFAIFPISSLTDSWSILTIVGTVIAAVSISGFVIHQLTKVIDTILVLLTKKFVHNWPVSRFITYGSTFAVVMVSVAVIVAVLPEIRLKEVGVAPPQLRQTQDLEVILDATYSLPGSPMALVFRGESDGYITLG